MSIFKKAVAAVAALAAVSSLGISAAAYADPDFRFSLFEDLGSWSKAAEKEDGDNYAGVHTDGGTVSATTPVYATIYSKKTDTPNNAYRVSGTRTLSSNSENTTITYTDSVYQKQKYYLRCEAGAYYVTISGYWNP